MDTNVLGNILGKDLMTSSYLMNLERDPFMILIGGSITADKLYALHNLV